MQPSLIPKIRRRNHFVTGLIMYILNALTVSIVKEIALTMIIAANVFTSAWSQVSFGIKAGLNIANQVNTGGSFTSSPGKMLGVHGGVYLHAKMGEFGLQPEAYYSMYGSNRNYSGASSRRGMLTYISF